MCSSDLHLGHQNFLGILGCHDNLELQYRLWHLEGLGYHLILADLVAPYFLEHLPKKTLVCLGILEGLFFLEFRFFLFSLVFLMPLVYLENQSVLVFPLLHHKEDY